jgi:N-sulfoglucosamine sulfohydrolase
MRKAVTDWMARVGDQGLINEPEMIQRMWPAGEQPETAQPYIVPRRSTDDPTRQESMTIKEPTEFVIYVPTQGASIAYTTEDGPAATWRLYTRPILVESAITLRAKAIRYGYKESKETRIVIAKQPS